MSIETPEELEAMRRIGAIVAEARDAMVAAVAPGVTTAQLDDVGRTVLERHGARSAPQLAYDFPGATCVSVNDEIAHGIPGARALCEGDLVNVDVSAELDGFWADTGASVPVGTISADRQRLLRATRAALDEAMAAVKPGRRVNVVAAAVQRVARREGFRVVANLCGHGVGRHIHEEPDIPNVVDRGNRRVFRVGDVFTIEPFLSPGARMALEDSDGWTLKTPDGSDAAQFEHTVHVTADGVEVLTASA